MQTAKLLVLHHAAGSLDDLSKSGKLDIFNDALGDTPCALDGSKQLGRGARVETARIVFGVGRSERGVSK